MFQAYRGPVPYNGFILNFRIFDNIDVNCGGGSVGYAATPVGGSVIENW